MLVQYVPECIHMALRTLSLGSMLRFRQGRSKLSFREILLGGLSFMLTDQGNALTDL